MFGVFICQETSSEGNHQVLVCIAFNPRPRVCACAIVIDPFVQSHSWGLEYGHSSTHCTLYKCVFCGTAADEVNR